MTDKKYWDFLTKNKFVFSEKGYDDFSDDLDLEKPKNKIEEERENTINDIIVEGDLIEEFRKKYK